MLQRLRVLETKGQEFSSKSLKDLKGSGTWWVLPRVGCHCVKRTSITHPASIFFSFTQTSYTSGADGDFLHQGTAESATLREIIHNEFLYPKDKYDGIHVVDCL